MTPYIPCVTCSTVSSVSGKRSDFAEKFFNRCGWTSSPPVATAAIIRTSCIGVTVTEPWPIATEIVSPAYHLWWYTRWTHSSEGIRPASSLGNRCQCAGPSQAGGVFMNPINSKPLPDGVEENVAGIHDGLVKIDNAVAPPAASSGRFVRKNQRGQDNRGQ